MASAQMASAQRVEKAHKELQHDMHGVHGDDRGIVERGDISH
jgi:hypothetical protein